MSNIEKRSTLMIGSMPSSSAAEASQLLAKYPLSIPVWCQLPKRSFKETMIPMYSEMFPGVVIDEAEKKVYVDTSKDLLTDIGTFYENFLNEDLPAFAITEEHAQGLHQSLAMLAANGSKVPFAKGQITGPFTFGLGLNDENLKPVWFNPEYRDVVLKGLTMKALWQVNELQKYADDVIIFLDEPIMSALGTPAYMSIQDEDVVECLNEVINAIQSKGAKVGVHCCGNMDWGLLAGTDVDIMAFDAYFFGEKVGLYPTEVTAFLEKGGYLAWGIVPTSGHNADDVPVHSETTESLNRKLEGLITLFIDKGIPEDLLRNQMLLTPSCGMGTMKIEDAEKALSLLASLKL